MWHTKKKPDALMHEEKENKKKARYALLRSGLNLPFN